MKHFLFIIFALLYLSTYAQTQNQPGPQTTEKKLSSKPDPLFNPVIIAGFNASQIWGDQVTGYRKFGFNGGAGVYIRLPKHFSVSFEILYSQKGSKSGDGETMVDSGRVYNQTKLIMDYIDVPLMINYHDKKRAIFGAGVTYTNLVRFQNLRRIDTAAVETPYIYSPSVPYNTAGLEFVGNITLIIYKHYGLNLRYNHSLVNINSRAISYSTEKNQSQQMDYLTLRFMYFIY